MCFMGTLYSGGSRIGQWGRGVNAWFFHVTLIDPTRHGVTATSLLIKIFPNRFHPVKGKIFNHNIWPLRSSTGFPSGMVSGSFNIQGNPWFTVMLQNMTLKTK